LADILPECSNNYLSAFWGLKARTYMDASVKTSVNSGFSGLNGISQTE